MQEQLTPDIAGIQRAILRACLSNWPIEMTSKVIQVIRYQAEDTRIARLEPFENWDSERFASLLEVLLREDCYELQRQLQSVLEE